MDNANEPSAEGELLTLPEAARLLGIDVRTAKQACKAGDIYSVRVGSRTFVPKGPLLALLNPAEK